MSTVSSYLKIQKAQPEKNYQIGQKIKIQQENLEPYSHGEIENLSWGTKYNILQKMPDFQVIFF